MARREVSFSDLSGEMMTDPDQIVNIVVEEHPDLVSPRALETTPEEIKSLGEIAIDPVILQVKEPGEEQPTRYVLTKEAFDTLAGEGDMDKILRAAAFAQAVGNVATKEVRDHTTIEWAGSPHKGKTAPEEASIVRRHLLQVNKNLASRGMRLIDPTDPAHKRRYGFPDDYVMPVEEPTGGESSPAPAETSTVEPSTDTETAPAEPAAEPEAAVPESEAPQQAEAGEPEQAPEAAESEETAAEEPSTSRRRSSRARKDA